MVIAALLSLGACSDYPRDSDDTLQRVRGGELRIGWPADSRADPELRSLVALLAERTGGTPKIEAGATEPLLMRLEAGELDLVVGHLDKKTPWSKRVTLSRPATTHDLAKGKVDAVVAMRNGEHAFAMEVDRAILALQGNGR